MAPPVQRKPPQKDKSGWSLYGVIHHPTESPHLSEWIGPKIHFLSSGGESKKSEGLLEQVIQITWTSDLILLV